MLAIVEYKKNVAIGVVLAALLLFMGGCGIQSESKASASSGDGEEDSVTESQEVIEPEVEKRVMISNEGADGDGYRYDYNEAGNVVVAYNCNFDNDTLKSCTLYSYDDNGELIKQETYDVDQFDSANHTYRLGKATGSITYERSAGIKTKTTLTGDGIVTSVIEYDQNDNPTKELSYSDGGTLKSEKTSVYTYDNDNHVLEGVIESDYFSTGEHFTREIKRDYNADGKIVRDVQSGGVTGEEQIDRMYEYDDSGRISKVDNSDGSYQIYQYASATSESPSRIDYYKSNGKSDKSYVYEYDIDGTHYTYQALISAEGSVKDERYYTYADLSEALAKPFATQSGAYGGVATDSAMNSKNGYGFEGTWKFHSSPYVVQPNGGTDNSAVSLVADLDMFDGKDRYLKLNQDGTYDMFDGYYQGTWKSTSDAMGTINIDGETFVLAIKSGYLQISEERDSGDWGMLQFERE